MRTTLDTYIEREKIYNKIVDLWNNNFVLKVRGAYDGTIQWVLDKDTDFVFKIAGNTIIIDKTQYELEKFENYILLAHKTDTTKNFTIKIYSVQEVKINDIF